jgi:hypothetical protein
MFAGVWMTVANTRSSLIRSIPKLWNSINRKNYFFADYEGNRETTSAPMLLFVPTQSERAGNLSALVAIPGSPGVLRGEMTGSYLTLWDIRNVFDVVKVDKVRWKGKLRILISARLRAD